MKREVSEGKIAVFPEKISTTFASSGVSREAGRCVCRQKNIVKRLSSRNFANETAPKDLYI